MNTANIRPGQSIAVFGLGGVGLAALIGAKACNAGQIIAVDLLDSKLEMASNLGATHTVNARENNPVEVIQDLTHGGVEIAIESV